MNKKEKVCSPSKAISVELYDSSRREEWESYVYRSSQTVIAHTIAWKSVVERTYGHKAFYLMAYQEGQVKGILPLFLVESMLFGKFLVTSPFLTFGGLACENMDVASALIDKARQIADNIRCDYMEVRNQNEYAFFKHTKRIYYSLILGLKQGEEKIWSSLKSGSRWSVNKSRKKLEVIKGPDQIDIFSDLHIQSMRRLGTPAHGKNFFLNVLKFFPDAQIITVRNGRKYIGTIFLLPFKDTIEVPWTASLKEYSKLRPNNLLFWEAIVYSCRKGFQYIDFGRSKWESGTFQFKAQFGARPVQLYYQYHLGKSRQVPDVDPNNKKFKFLIDIWRKLPLGLVTLIGPRIIRDIP